MFKASNLVWTNLVNISAILTVKAIWKVFARSGMSESASFSFITFRIKFAFAFTAAQINSFLLLYWRLLISFWLLFVLGRCWAHLGRYNIGWFFNFLLLLCSCFTVTLFNKGFWKFNFYLLCLLYLIFFNFFNFYYLLNWNTWYFCLLICFFNLFFLLINNL